MPTKSRPNYVQKVIYMTTDSRHRLRKIIVAMDSFKDCLTATEVARAVRQGICDACPALLVDSFPVSDGGDGMLEVLIQATKGRYESLVVHGPLMHLHKACYGLSSDGQTAFIEMATASGLNLVPANQRNPMLTTTYGTGELILDALKQGCRNFIIGLGGSATNDAGLGMLQALGFRFYNGQKKELCSGKDEFMNGDSMGEVRFIDTSNVYPAVWDSNFMLACDVQAPFCGMKGAAYIFAPQKGADENMVETLDTHLQQIASIVRQKTGQDIAALPGAGAAGGMAGTMVALLHANIAPGAQLMLNTLHFKERIAGADLIITGEGKSDRQTLMGKIPSGILKEAIGQHIPTILLSGCIEDVDELNKAGFLGVFSTTPYPMPLSLAIEPDMARQNIRQAARQLMRLLTHHRF